MLFGFRPALLAALWLSVLPGCRDEEQAEVAAPLPEVGNTPGRRAPALTGRLGSGEAFTLSFGGAGATVLVFYRGWYCGLCREQLRALTARGDTYRRQNARVVAVTLDIPAEVSRTARATSADFPLVSVDTATFLQWGALDPERRKPRPATFVLDSRGVIRYRHVGRNAADRADEVELLAVLEQIRSP